jgi:hypothetical protein
MEARMSQYNKYVPPSNKPQGNLLAATLIMLIGPVVFFFIPIIGPFVIGIIGGKVAGSPGRAVTAALIPAFIAAALLVILSAVFHPFAAIFGILAGIGLIILAIFHGIALLLGAIIGGVL